MVYELAILICSESSIMCTLPHETTLPQGMLGPPGDAGPTGLDGQQVSEVYSWLRDESDNIFLKQL